jgi:hypothetical protein
MHFHIAYYFNNKPHSEQQEHEIAVHMHIAISQKTPCQNIQIYPICEQLYSFLSKFAFSIRTPG